MTIDNMSATLDQLVSEAGWLRRLAGSLVANPADAEDLVHDAYLIAAAQAPADGRPLRPWLARVVTNLARMTGRSRTRRQAREQALAAQAVAPATPAARVDRVELQRVLAGLVLRLPPALRDVVLLRYVEGLSSVAIGNRLGVADSTVRWRLKQALDELRAKLDGEAPNRAWLAPVAALSQAGGPGPGAPAVGLPLAKIAVVLALWMLIVGLGARWLPDRAASDRPAAHRAAGRVGRDGREGRDGPAMVAAPPASATPAGPDGGPRRVTGHVVDADGRPAAGAEVHAICLETFLPASTRSRPDGSFEVDLDPDCDGELFATLGDRMGAAGSHHPEPSPAIVIALHPSPVARLRIIDARTGEPIAGAVAASWPPGGEAIAVLEPRDESVSGADGVARLRWLGPPGLRAVASGEVKVFVHAHGYLATALVLGSYGQLPDELATERTVALTAGVVVAGHVLDATGAPVPRARVDVTGTPAALGGFTVRADDHGRFELSVPRAGRYRASAAHRHAAGQDPALDLEVPGSGLENVVLTLDAARQVHGTVVDRDGRPVAGARVTSSHRTVAARVTDGNGAFTIPDAPDDLDLVAWHGRLASAYHHIAAGDPGGVTLELGPSGLAGVVVDASGAPIPHADVWLNGCCVDHPRRVRGKHAIADEAGRFSLAVPRGDYVLSVRRDSEDDYLDEDDRVVTAGTDDLRLVLP